MEQIMNYVKPELMIVAVVLYFIGMSLKHAQAVKDKYIPLILGAAGRAGGDLCGDSRIRKGHHERITSCGCLKTRKKIGTQTARGPCSCSECSSLNTMRNGQKEDISQSMELKTFTEMYDAYHTLGGNGMITHLLKEVKELPIN